jgi:hypothetical protein
MTKQWDKYREAIIAEYKDQNKPLHEVQRVMMQKYGFRASYVNSRVVVSGSWPAQLGRWLGKRVGRVVPLSDRCIYSTRADRSRFDRWGIHKYSRRRGRRESVSDGDVHPSPRQSPDIEESSSQETTPVVTTPDEFPGLCVATSSAGFRR